MKAVVLFFVLATFTTNALAETGKDRLHAFLIKDVGIAAETVAKLDKELIVAKLPVGEDAQEIAAMGVVHIAVPKAFFIKKVHDLESVIWRTAFKQRGVFSKPPAISDMASFQLPESSMEVMRSCKPGNCKIKLPGNAIEYLKTFDWSKTDWKNELNDLFRKGIVSYIKQYTEHGNPKLVTYGDKPKPQFLSEGLERILQHSPYVHKYVPELPPNLLKYPHEAPKGVEELFYWAIEDLGLRPVTEIHHLVVYDRPQTGTTVIAEKQIYSSHYFWARFLLTAIIEEGVGNESPSIYAFYLDRCLLDDKLGSFRQSKLLESVLKKVRSLLVTTRDRLESEYASEK